MRIELPDLPYPADALEPWISRRTLQVHHGKHHRGYVDKVKALVGESGETLEAVIARAAGDASQRVLFNNAAQAWNHAGWPGGSRRPCRASPLPRASAPLHQMHESHLANIARCEQLLTD